MNTIDQFLATKRWSDDLGEAIGFDTGDGNVGGWIYANTHYIEDTGTWKERGERRGRFYLLLDRSEFFSDRIEPLESRVYAWWLSDNADVFAPIVQNALDAALAEIQKVIAVNHGDVAAHHFGKASRGLAEFTEVMVEYLITEATK
jgi:hypothetical protein